MNIERIKVIRDVSFMLMFILVTYVFIVDSITLNIFEYTNDNELLILGNSMIVFVTFISLLISCIATSVILVKNNYDIAEKRGIKLLSYITLILFISSIIILYIYNGFELSKLNKIIYYIIAVNASTAIVSSFYTFSWITWI